MADIDALLQPPARHFYEEIATEVDRSHLDIAFRNICENPDIDNEVKYALPIGKGKWLVVYSDGRYIIVYHHLNNWTLSILNISYAGEFWEPSEIPTVGPIL